MSEIIDDHTARARVAADIARLTETFNGDTQISSVDLEWYEAIRANSRDTKRYSDGRTKEEVAVKLGVSATQLSKLLRGQNVLDIGSGRGVFAADVAKDKSVHITALDYDAKVLADVPDKPNITPLQGDGYDLIGSGLSPESFDSVFVTYSTNYWARSVEELEKSISEPMKVLKPGGKIFYTPIAQNLSMTDAYLHGLIPTPSVEKVGHHKYHRAYGLLAIKAYQSIINLEEAGAVEVAFRASNKNKQFPKKELADGRLVSLDSFSVVLTDGK